MSAYKSSRSIPRDFGVTVLRACTAYGASDDVIICALECSRSSCPHGYIAHNSTVDVNFIPLAKLDV